MSGIFDQVINYAPPSLLLGTVTYKGTWSAATNTPTLPNPPSSITNGNYYVVSAAGTQFSLSFNIGDWIISNGSAWEKVDNTDAVSSVFGRMGAVVGVSTDYSAVGITNTALGASNPSTVAATTITATSTIAATGAVTGSNLSGTNTGDQTISLTGGVTGSGTGSFAATVVTNANLTGVITSVGNATSIASQTGTGSTFVVSGSPTITTPVIAQINDASGNETLKLASIASAVNEVTIENAATGNAVHISATGGDASVGLHLAGKGASGYVNIQDSTDATKRIMFNASGGTTNTRTMLSSTQTVDRTISLPDATDTLVGKATTDTLTNKTLTSPTLTAPILGTPASGTVTNLTGTASININGTVGATTPSTIAATTISATGTATFSAGTTTQTADGLNSAINFTAGVTAANYSGMNFRGSTSYNSFFGRVPLALSGVNDAVGYTADGVLRVLFSSTGLAITGALSATGAITQTGGGGSPIAITGATTGATLNSIANSGGTSYWGLESSAGGTFTGTTSYSFILGSGSNRSTQIIANATKVADFSSTGLAVTGTLSSTSNLSTTGDLRVTDTGSSHYILIGNQDSGGANKPNIIRGVNGTLSLGYGTSWSSSGGGTLTSIADISSTGLAVTGVVTATGNVGLAAGTLLTLNGNNTSAAYALQAATLASPYDFRFMGSSDSGTNRNFSFGYYTGDSSANAWNAKVTINSYTGAVRFNGYGAGSLTTDGSGNITAVSDERIKSNIRPFSRGLSDIIGINPILHGYTTESGLDQSRDDYAGFSAQQVQPLIPEAIGVNADGMLSFSDRPIMAALVNAIKELSARLAALESK